MSRRWWILTSISLGTFVSVLNINLVNVALPTISRVMDLEISQVQWVVLVFSVTVAATLLIAGNLADLVGRKKVYSGGFLVLMLGSLVCGLAPNFPVLLVGRFIQGLGAAMPMANGMAITTTTFPVEERGRALGIVGSMVGVGSLTGPVLGGFLIDVLGWHWVFFINIPLGLLAFLTALVLLPQDSQSRQHEGFDGAGAFLFAVSMVLFLLALSGVADRTTVFALTTAGVAVFGIFLWWEKNQEAPLLDLGLFKIPLFSTSLAAAFFAYLSMAALLILGPFYLEEVLGCSPSQVGFLMAPYPLLLTLVAPLSGWLSDHWGPVYLTTGGLLLNVFVLLSLGFLGSDTSYLDLALRFALLGLGMGMFHSPNNSTLMGSVPFSKLGVAGGANALVRNLGMLLGTTVVVLLFSSFQGRYLAGIEVPSRVQEIRAFLHGWQAAFTFAALAAALGACFSGIRVRIFNRREADEMKFKIVPDR